MEKIDVKQYVINLMKTRRKTYLEEPIRILEDYRKEKEKIDEYNGRQLLELLQNADDAAGTATKKECYICLKGKKLIVANNGEKFSAKGIESLMYSNLSPKAKEQNKIGQKGLGFRSVLSWANKVTIKSYDFAVEFSKDIALEFLHTIEQENTEISNVLKDRSSNDETDTIAILRCPRVIDAPTSYSDYDTYIVIDLKDDQTENVQKQIDEEIDKEMLLFLNNLDKVVIESPGRNFCLEKSSSANSICITETDLGESHTNTKTWHLNTKKGEIYGKNYELKIAWTDALDDSKNKLFSYFKTNVSFPFPALIHGTFDLTSDRNHLLPESEFNNELKEILKDFIIEIASQIANGWASYAPLRLLNVKDNEFITTNEIVEKIKESDKKLFPTITGEYISFKSGPFYLEQDYAGIISSIDTSNFQNLLQHTSERPIIDLLRSCGTVHLPNNDFISKLAQMSLDLKTRAKIVFWLSQENYGELKPTNLPIILIDGSGHPATIDDDLFLPPLTQPLKIPDGFYIKILNTQLYNELQALFNCTNRAEVLASKLSAFAIKPYRFMDILRNILAKENAKQKNTKHQYNSELLGKLYELYASNKDTKFEAYAPNAPSIYVKNRKGKDIKTTDVYLGKEYGNKLCEQLYHYDQSKFVASPKKLGFNGADDNGFMLWLGIADRPRSIDVQITDNEKKHYGDYILERFPYESKYIYAYDQSITSFEKLKKCGYDIVSIKATSIDDLDNILLNSDLETIIAWFSTDNRISNKGEPHDESRMTIYIHRKNYNTPIDSRYMPAYLRWKLQNAQWISTVDGHKARPIDCCLTKTKEISLLINTPKIDYESKLLKEKNLTRNNINHILLDIGVKQEISELPAKVVYKALNRLSDGGFDPDGKKAQTLYKELIENFEKDNIDMTSPERIDFVTNGKVLCKTVNGFSFQPVSEAYYVHDRIYGDNIINQFSTIAIDKRKNTSIIEGLFGVKTLAELQFSVKSHTEPNETLNKALKDELVKLNPYIYALRNAKEKELNRLKEPCEVVVCSQIEPEYKKQGDSSSNGFELNDYEFVYDQKQNTYYILVKNCGSMNFSVLKTDYKFADVIAEIYSNILKVDSIRDNISRLFRSDQKERDYILGREVNNSQTVLQEAHKALNVVSDQKVLFWLRVLEVKNKRATYKEYDKDELAGLVDEKIHINIDDYSIDYNELTSPNCSVTEIRRLFESLRISIDQFNKGADTPIDLIPYYTKRIFDLKTELENQFACILYEYLKSKTVDEKMEYLTTIQQYKNFKEFHIKNSLSVDLKSILQKNIQSQFDIDINEAFVETDLTTLYHSNFNKLTNGIKKSERNDFKDFINDKDNLSSLVYFGEFETIIECFRKSHTVDKPGKEIQVNGANITGDNFEDLYQGLTEQRITTSIDNIQTEGLPMAPDESSSPKHGGGNGRKPLSEKRKKNIGFVGEVVVFETLKERGVESLSWDSEYAKDAGVNHLGSEKNHYDLRYKINDEYHFVEVKSTTSSNLEFEISEPEFEFAMSKGGKYEIYIVTNVEDKNRKINNIGNPFIFEEGESLTNCQKFTVLNDQFIIKMKKRE